MKYVLTARIHHGRPVSMFILIVMFLFIAIRGASLQENQRGDLNTTAAEAKARGVIIFQREGKLWLADAEGRSQRQLTEHSVSHFSVSKNGRIAYDRFDAFAKDPASIELNVYYIENVLKARPVKLTSDGESVWPYISPEGRNIVFQRFKWHRQPNFSGSGLGLWLIETGSGATYPLAEVVPIPSKIREARDRLSSQYFGSMDAAKWSRDGKVIWSPTGSSLIFSRSFQSGGYLSFLVDLTSRRPPEVLPEYIVEVDDFFGNRVLIHSCSRAKGLLCIYEMPSFGELPLVEVTYAIDPKFSPDGLEVIFSTSADISGESGLWLISSVERKKVKLAPEGEQAVWSEQGSAILFSRGSEIWKVNRDGSGLKLLITNAAAPHWTVISDP